MRDLAAREKETQAAWRDVQGGLAQTYQDPAGAERLVAKLSRAEGLGRAAEELAQRPERFGQLRQEEHRTLGIVTRRTDDQARAWASRTAQGVDRYQARWRELVAERERAPRALREAEAAKQLADARTEARPGERAAERRIEGLGRALGRGEQKALERAAPEASKVVERVVARAIKKELDRGLDLGR